MLCITGHVLLRSDASVRGWMDSSGMYVLGLFLLGGLVYARDG